MAGIFAKINSDEITVPTTGQKTILRILAPATQRVKVCGFSITFKGIKATEPPIKVEIIRQVAGAGTWSGTAPIISKNNPADDEGVNTTAQKDQTGTEPGYPDSDSAANTLYAMEVHPQGGWQMILPFGQEIIVAGGTYLAIRITTNSNEANNYCIAQFDIEE